MKHLTRDDLKKLQGGKVAPPASPCSSGKCGPADNQIYNCSTDYNSNGDPVACCCGHSSYDSQCDA